jgi:hypothetical protein
MKFKSQIFTQVSGSVGGLTFSRNKGGLYTRARSIPTNPATAAQVAARDALSTLVDAWTNSLTSGQRDAWATYALNTPVVDVFGDSKLLSGQQMYIRSNQPRLRSGVARIDDGPATFDLGTFTTPSITISAAAPTTVNISFTDTDEWANNDGAFLINLMSRGQNPSVNFFKAPFQFAKNIIGLTAGPAVSPEAFPSPFTYTEGQKVFMSSRASQADARLSTSQIVSTIVTA